VRASDFTLSSILEWHWRRYPLLGAADAYKLIHQGVFGPGHIVASASAALANLRSELLSLDASGYPDTADTEPLDPDGRFIRVNLVPLVGNTEALGRLGDALVESSRAQGTAAAMKERLGSVVEWFGGVMPDIGHELAAIAREVEGAGFPALHHTALYAQAFRPAYRVILAALWPESD
jgi:hypothetical protein